MFNAGVKKESVKLHYWYIVVLQGEDFQLLHHNNNIKVSCSRIQTEALYSSFNYYYY